MQIRTRALVVAASTAALFTAAEMLSGYLEARGAIPGRLVSTVVGALGAAAAVAVLAQVLVFRPLRRLTAEVARVLATPTGSERLSVHGDAATHTIAEAINRMLAGIEEANHAIAESELRLRAVFANAAAGLAVIGSKGTFEQANDRWAAMLGYGPDELLGKAPTDVIDPDDLLEALPGLDGQDLRDIDIFRIEARCTRKDGVRIWADLSASGIRGPEGGLAAIVLIAVDISEIKRAQEELAALSRQDSLTGLANRRAFEDLLGQEWRRSLRSSTPIGVLLCDVDLFKAYNDAYGHLAGDECLKQIADVLRHCFRDGVDLPARWGGEEFTVVLVDADERQVTECAERLRESVADARIPRPGQTPDHVTISVGGASVKAGAALAANDLVAAADAAMYCSKRDGRDRVTIGSVVATRLDDRPTPD